MEYTIYQVKSGMDTRDFRYTGLDMMKRLNMEVDKENYDEVYTGSTEFESTVNVILEELFYTFNMDHPADYRGQSMSVSDVIKLDGDFYFCDSCGFKKILNLGI
jgi:hypothetical protein